MQADLPLIEEDDLVEHRLDVGDQVRADDDGGLWIVVGNDGVQDVIPRCGVDAADRLVEQVELCLAAHCQHELHLLLHALRHLADGLVEVQAEVREHPLCGLPVEIGVEITVEVQQLPRFHPRAERDAVGQVGHDGVRLRRRGFPVDQNFTARGLKQAHGELDERGFAAAVRAEQADDAARFERKIDVVERHGGAVALFQRMTFKNWHLSFPPSGSEM